MFRGAAFAAAQVRRIFLRMTKAELFGFISGCKLAVLASVSPEGVPQSALVGIAVTEELEIVFDTLDTTRKFRNLTVNSKASFVIGWFGEKTVQFEGEAFLPEGQEQEDLLWNLAGRVSATEVAGNYLLCCSSAMDPV